MTTEGGSLFPLPSKLRSPEAMEWIHDRYKVDALERLARSTPDYYETHGNYLPDVSALAHAAIEEAARLLDRLNHAEGQIRALVDGLVCSNCGEAFEGDPENMGSDCCSCDLVPAHALPSLLKQAREELERVELRLGDIEEALHAE